MSLLDIFRKSDPPKPRRRLPFTPRAQRVLELAREHAQREDRQLPNSSDIIIGLLGLGQGVAWNVLNRFSIDLRAAASKTPPTATTPVPFTELLPTAETEMRNLQHTYLGTEHLLLALLADKTNCLSAVLNQLGLTADVLREEILRELDPNYTPPAIPHLFSAHWFEPLFQKYPSPVPHDEVAFVCLLIHQSNFQAARDRSVSLLTNYPNDHTLIVLHGLALRGTGEFSAAEKVWDQLLQQLSEHDALIYARVLTHKLLLLLLQAKATQFHAAYEQFQSTPISDDARVELLDSIATHFLTLDQPDTHGLAEFCARRALEIAPGELSLQGTLGAILAERGAFDEAAPHLSACIESPATHDRGITSYYLALAAEHRGDHATARKLLQQSITLHPDPWLIKKANALLHRIEK